MKLDLIIYNDTSMIGLIYLPEWIDAPVISFIHNSEEILGEDEKKEYFLRANYAIEERPLTIKLNQTYKSGDIIQPEDYRILAVHYADLEKRGLDVNIKDKNYYELACVSDRPFILNIIEKLGKNLIGKNQEYYFKCAKLLGDSFNGVGYRIQAYCYQEGIYVKKSCKPVFKLLKKAAECGDELSIEWIIKENKDREKLSLNIIK